MRKEFSALRANYFMDGLADLGEGLTDIGWFDEKGTPMNDEAWQFAEGRLLACRRVCRCEGALDATLLLMNGAADTHDFTLPEPAIAWRLAIDSAHPDAPEAPVTEATIAVEAHSAVLLVARHQPGGQ